MKKLAAIAISLMPISLAACVNWTDPERLESRDISELCGAYFLYGRGSAGPGFHYPDRERAIRAEIIRRNAVPTQDWAAIDQGVMTVGMGECSALAAWGNPGAINRTVTAQGAMEQWVYFNNDGLPTHFAYITGGQVTVVQD